jgi:hypothetical protein
MSRAEGRDYVNAVSVGCWGSLGPRCRARARATQARRAPHRNARNGAHPALTRARPHCKACRSALTGRAPRRDDSVLERRAGYPCGVCRTRVRAATALDLECCVDRLARAQPARANGRRVTKVAGRCADAPLSNRGWTLAMMCRHGNARATTDDRRRRCRRVRAERDQPSRENDEARWRRPRETTREASVSWRHGSSGGFHDGARSSDTFCRRPRARK